MTVAIVLQKQLCSDREGAVWNLLCECDNEFVPPLSARGSSFQTDLACQGRQDHDVKPHSYFTAMKQQCFLLAEVENEVVGFMTFRRNYTCSELASASPGNYITTICVKGEWRRKGVAKAFYDFMLGTMDRDIVLPYVTTRTWSTNTGHINLLQGLGFRLVARLPNHRGEGIDTLYYAKSISEHAAR